MSQANSGRKLATDAGVPASRCGLGSGLLEQGGDVGPERLAGGTLRFGEALQGVLVAETGQM
jgi:hypothetical protein